MKKQLRLARVSRWIAVLSGVVFASTVHAQELSVFGGWLRADRPGESAYTWGFTYLQALDAYNALSYSWLNEGHVQDSHRDGFALQYWRRAAFFDRRLSLAAGVGVYSYFDTEFSVDNKPYVDSHGLGTIFSLSATWFTNERLFYQLRVNEILAPRSYNTFNVMFGIGYELDAPKTGGSLAGGTSDSVSSGDQITAMAGATEVNSLRSPGAFAYGFEYRHGFGRYFDGTISWINEGHTPLDTRSGAAAQVWLRRSFFGDKLSLGVGVGPYYATDTHRVKDGTDTGGNVSLLLTMSAAYNLTRHWYVRASWNRVMTSYDKDSDIYLGGIGYRF
ncbi:hypothetical protein [Paraburkholderia caffeinilytica]|uniref:hypothetical protein n=1 Tax=Paraburkholderia caffeinilytica TaxID=1761016 RepID=UPI0038B92A83